MNWNNGAGLATVLIFLIGQTVTAVWWAATVSASVRTMQNEQRMQNARLSSLEDTQIDLLQSIVKLQSELESMKDDLQNGAY